MSGVILAVDFGKKRVGLAVSDEERRFSLPLETLVIDKETHVVDELIAVCKSRDVTLVIFGLPRHLNGAEGAMAEKVRKVAKAFHQKSGIAVDFIDERLTSVIAQQALKASGVQPSRSKHLVDQEAARLMLQNYLDKLSLSTD